MEQTDFMVFLECSKLELAINQAFCDKEKGDKELTCDEWVIEFFDKYISFHKQDCNSHKTHSFLQVQMNGEFGFYDYYFFDNLKEQLECDCGCDCDCNDAKCDCEVDKAKLQHFELGYSVYNNKIPLADTLMIKYDLDKSPLDVGLDIIKNIKQLLKKHTKKIL